MPGKSQDFSEETFTFKRAWWKIVGRWLVFSLLIGLNVSLIGGTYARYIHGHAVPLPILVSSYLVVIFFDLIIFLPLLLEVDAVWILPDKVILKTLLWQSKLDRKNLVSMQNPAWLNFVILRTQHCFYLLHRKDLEPFDMLVSKIVEKLG